MVEIFRGIVIKVNIIIQHHVPDNLQFSRSVRRVRADTHIIIGGINEQCIGVHAEIIGKINRTIRAESGERSPQIMNLQSSGRPEIKNNVTG